MKEKEADNAGEGLFRKGLSTPFITPMRKRPPCRGLIAVVDENPGPDEAVLREQLSPMPCQLSSMLGVNLRIRKSIYLRE